MKTKTKANGAIFYQGPSLRAGALRAALLPFARLRGPLRSRRVVRNRTPPRERALPYVLVTPRSRCFACGRLLRHGRALAVLSEDGAQRVVGAECFQRTLRAGRRGYQPPAGGPRLVALTHVEGTVPVISN